MNVDDEILEVCCRKRTNKLFGLYTDYAFWKGITIFRVEKVFIETLSSPRDAHAERGIATASRLFVRLSVLH